MSDSTTGEIYDSSAQKSVEWKIPDYFLLPQKADSAIESPEFHFSNASWCLVIYPNGRRSKHSVDWVGLSLELVHSESVDVFLDFTIGIKDCEGKVHHKVSTFYGFKKGKSGVYECSKFIKIVELVRNQHKTTPGGTLTVFCTAKSFSSSNNIDASSQTKSAFGVSGLCKDFDSLLHSELKSDVTIKVESQLFRAHKLILSARSAVFAKMFEHNMKENSTGTVNIEDCDPSTFRDFLSFIYTGEMNELSPKNITQMFTLSDKYDLRDLRQMCLGFIKDNLSVDTACEIISIADRHNEEELKTLAKKLILDNINTLLPTDQWISFMRDNRLLATELLMTFIPVTKT